MKTTIDIPDEILHRAKIVSAQRKTTLKALIMNGLKQELDGVSDNKIEVDSLVEALSKGRNNQPVGKLSREEIYDRPLLH